MRASNESPLENVLTLKPKCKSTLDCNKKSFRHEDTSDLRQVSKAWLVMLYSLHNVD